jgi:RNA polymerase sigma factor (sigma-70 family)
VTENRRAGTGTITGSVLVAQHAFQPTRQDIPVPASGEQQQALAAAIEQHWEELLVDSRVWVRSLGLQGDLEALAWDALQEAIATALRCAGRYDVRCAARPWLRRILFNVIRTVRRDMATERRHVLSLTDAAESALRASRGHSTAEGNLSDDELLGILGAMTEASHTASDGGFEDLLALAGEADQEVLRLAYGDGLRGAALGARLGISEGAAYTRLSRALARLRTVYRESYNRQQDGS